MSVVFRWARIGDGNPEPVAVKTVDGTRLAFTIGCPDGFPLGRRGAVLLGPKMEADYDFLTPEQQAREDKNARIREARYRRMNPSHGYAGFGRPS